jgi:regulator of replication initiation timing
LVTHLNQQNEELYDNYIRSTRLAFAVGRENLNHAKRAALINFMNNARMIRANKFEEVLAANIELIAGLKNKMSDIEKDNDLLANENEELRQFTLDGYQIAKSVQSLDQEREKLSIDLADKAATIKKLLDENERLSSKLRLVQEQVVRTADEMQNFSRRDTRSHNNVSGRGQHRQF